MGEREREAAIFKVDSTDESLAILTPSVEQTELDCSQNLGESRNRSLNLSFSLAAHSIPSRLCPLCQSLFSSKGTHTPLLLICGHSFCKICLDRVTCNPDIDRIRCSCGVDTCMDSQSEFVLEKNQALLELLEVEQLHSQKPVARYLQSLTAVYLHIPFRMFVVGKKKAALSANQQPPLAGAVSAALPTARPVAWPLTRNCASCLITSRSPSPSGPSPPPCVGYTPDRAISSTARRTRLIPDNSIPRVFLYSLFPQVPMCLMCKYSNQHRGHQFDLLTRTSQRYVSSLQEQLKCLRGIKQDMTRCTMDTHGKWAFIREEARVQQMALESHFSRLREELLSAMDLRESRLLHLLDSQVQAKQDMTHEFMLDLCIGMSRVGRVCQASDYILSGTCIIRGYLDPT